MTDPSDGSSGSKEGEDMNPSQAAEHLRIIRELMERPIVSTTRSGASGLIAGVLALAGCVATWRIEPGIGWSHPARMVTMIWLAVLVLAVTGDLALTRYRSRKSGQSWWKRAQKQTALAIAPSFIISGAVTVVLAKMGYPAYIPFAWMLCYGLALWSVGLLSIVEVKLLGAAFMAAGVAGLFWGTPYPVASMAVTFGGFHLIYGIVVWKRHGG
jgi:hypothetical protein